MTAPQKKETKREKLDVPGVSPLERRLNLLAPATDTSKPGIGPVKRSSVLERLQGFMPQMQAANAQLQEAMQDRRPEDFDIEAVNEETQDGYIEMDLACGVLDLLDEGAVGAADRVMQGLADQMAGPEGDEAQDTDSSDSEDEEEVMDADSGQPGPQGTGQGAPGMHGQGDTRAGLAPGHMQEAGTDEDMGVDGDGQGQGQGTQAQRIKVRAKRTSKIQELD